MAIPSYCVIVEEKERRRADIHGYNQLLYYCLGEEGEEKGRYTWLYPAIVLLLRRRRGEGPIYMAIPSYCIIVEEKRRGRRRANIHGYTKLLYYC